MRIFVIHLCQATCAQYDLHERNINLLLESLHAQDKHEIEVFEAIYAKSEKGLHPLVRAHAQSYFINPHIGLHKNYRAWLEACYYAIKFRGKMMSLGELGCYASHYTLWQRCVALQEPICVLEDDIMLQSHFFESLAHLQEHIETLGWVRLMHLFSYLKIPTTISKVQEIRENTCGSGTQGYCITPKVASIFLEVSKNKWVMPVDWVMENHYLHGVRNFVIEPFMIAEEQNLSTQGNVIREEYKCARSLSWLRELNRFYVQLHK
ncbi:glycosyltransferase family 25 protein [Helicobacter baculiformis]|uniref:Glycosyltransferase family 25 protein n=1 Tax=Helicobacter baculiformis TaxID=427351 RepID=A0ABV7ZKX8_9HELI|nr:glycosyltransferase family 25 protein [Helicobacter baculiformis]